MTELNQRDATRNQSTADYSQKKIFLFNNRYEEGIFKNNTASEMVLRPGTLLLRDVTTPTQVIRAIAGSTLVDVIGILKLDGPVDLAPGETIDINFGISGDVDETNLVLPEGVTLDTVPIDADKTLRDYLQALGFKLQVSVSMDKFDN